MGNAIVILYKTAIKPLLIWTCRKADYIKGLREKTAFFLNCFMWYNIVIAEKKTALRWKYRFIKICTFSLTEIKARVKVSVCSLTMKNLQSTYKMVKLVCLSGQLVLNHLKKHDIADTVWFDTATITSENRGFRANSLLAWWVQRHVISASARQSFSSCSSFVFSKNGTPLSWVSSEAKKRQI